MTAAAKAKPTRAKPKQRVVSVHNMSYYSVWRHLRLRHSDLGQTYVTRAEHDDDHDEYGPSLDHVHIRRTRTR